MSALSRPPVFPSANHLDTEAETELAHHFFDLRVHAGIMLANAGLAAYCVFRICAPDDPGTPGGAIPDFPVSSFMSLVAVATFSVVALLCVMEACRCVLKARRAAKADRGPHATINQSSTRSAAEFWKQPGFLAGWHTRLPI